MKEAQYIEIPAGYAEQPSVNYNDIPATLQMPDKAELLDKLSPERVVETLRFRLMGYEKEGEKWIKKWDGMSEFGAWEVTSVMLSASSQNVSISNLTDHEIRCRTLSVIKTVQYMCLENLDQYGIKSMGS